MPKLCHELLLLSLLIARAGYKIETQLPESVPDSIVGQEQLNVFVDDIYLRTRHKNSLRTLSQCQYYDVRFITGWFYQSQLAIIAWHFKEKQFSTVYRTVQFFCSLISLVSIILSSIDSWNSLINSSVELFRSDIGKKVTSAEAYRNTRMDQACISKYSTDELEINQGLWKRVRRWIEVQYEDRIWFLLKKIIWLRSTILFLRIGSSSLVSRQVLVFQLSGMRVCTA